jgi:DivIVA domain-containing protein
VTLLLTVLVIAVVVGVAAVATGRITGGLDDPVSSLPARLLPDRDEVAATDVERVRFSPALRGYRMEEVDEVLDRVVAELARRDEVIERLRHRLAEADLDADLDADERAPGSAELAEPAGHPVARDG